jgi:hypothetical protein
VVDKGWTPYREKEFILRFSWRLHLLVAVVAVAVAAATIVHVVFVVVDANGCLLCFRIKRQDVARDFPGGLVQDFSGARLVMLTARPSQKGVNNTCR